MNIIGASTAFAGGVEDVTDEFGGSWRDGWTAAMIP